MVLIRHLHFYSISKQQIDVDPVFGSDPIWLIFHRHYIPALLVKLEHVISLSLAVYSLCFSQPENPVFSFKILARFYLFLTTFNHIVPFPLYQSCYEII